MKKVGIITFHCADNFGAVLQVYALQRIIEDLNMNVEIIDFRPKKLVQPYDHSIDFKKAIKRYGYMGIFKIILSQIHDYRSIEKRINAFRIFRNNYLNIAKYTYNSAEELLNNPPIYDYYISGSDQVWNPFFRKDIGNSYFLNFARDKSIKISYAASIAEKVDDSFIEVYKKYINKFDYISIREKSSIKFLKDITDKNVEVTLDPTLLLDEKSWDKISKPINTKEKYMLVYDLQYNSELIQLANKLSEKTGLKIICFFNTKNYKNASKAFRYNGPDEFLGYFKNAELVLSNSFHGTVFSIIYNKPFYTVPRRTGDSRMIDFLEDLGLQDRIIYKSNDLQKVSYDINFIRVNKIIEIKKQESIDFLKKALDIIN